MPKAPVGRLTRRPLTATRLRRTGAAAVVAGMLLAGCSGPSGAGGSTTSVPDEGSVTTTTIVPETVAGTTEGGALGYLGSVSRIPVMAVPKGLTTTEVPLPGTTAYKRVVPIGYRQSGSGASLLLIAGQDASMTWWSPTLIQALDQHYRVTMFDLPGVGYSGGPTAPLSIDWLADMSAGLSDELGLSKPVVLGWGMGGQIAVALAERHPGLVSDLVLVDTGLPTAGSQPMKAAVARLLSSPTSTPAAISRVMFPPSDSTARHQWLRELAAQVPDDVTSETISGQARLEADYWRGNDAASGLQSLRLPVLIVAGRDDAVFPVDDAASLSAAVPGSQHYIRNGTGYAALVQDPPQFVSVMQEFTG